MLLFLGAFLCIYHQSVEAFTKSTGNICILQEIMSGGREVVNMGQLWDLGSFGPFGSMGGRGQEVG